MNYLKVLYFSLLVLLSLPSLAEQLVSHEASSEETQKALENNDRWHQRKTIQYKPINLQPVEDTAQFAYVLMTAYEGDESEVTNLRKTIASNLPPQVKLVILTDSWSAADTRKKYLKWVSADRLIIATDSNTSNGFWARDAFPIPVYSNNNRISLVAANYFRDFQSWQAIANSVKAKWNKVDFTFVGGNLIADEEGNCFAVDSSRLYSLKEEDLKLAYGCKQVHFFSYLRGIGDIDEVLKPLPQKQMLTSVPEYKNDLQALGYEVILLPPLEGTYRTYVNSLIVNNIVFMPIYNVPEDEEAKQIYKDLGYKVIPIKSANLSDYYNGSVHCQTMAYPDIELNELLKILGVKVYSPT
jgi:hypothetical protein